MPRGTTLERFTFKDVLSVAPAIVANVTELKVSFRIVKEFLPAARYAASKFKCFYGASYITTNCRACISDKMREPPLCQYVVFRHHSF